MEIKARHIDIDITKGKYDKRFIYLLISLLTFLFGSLFIPTEFAQYLSPIILLQFTFAGLILFRNHNRIIYRLILAMAFILLLAEALKFASASSKTSILVADFIYVVYFIVTTIEVFRQILLARTVDFNMVAGSFCGFIMLGLLGAFILMFIETSTPGAFSGVRHDDVNERLQDLIYYSFVTILTVGYGDILPATQTARKASLLIGIGGYFYNIFVIGITISKFLQHRRKDEDN